jgi:tRNA U34 5-methylaminomethyl-2-thiouridine-forming methyltransferase MnmC
MNKVSRAGVHPSCYSLVQLSNGTFSVHSLEYGETFHPVIGPAAEAEALYVQQLHLVERFKAQSGDFVVWDVGLGAAANALTVIRSMREIPGLVRVVSFDQTLQPLRFALEHSEQLPYLAGFEQPLSQLANEHETEVCFTDGSLEIQWEMHLGDFPGLLQTPAAARMPKPDAILFDAFSPATNPAMWTAPLFARLYQLLDPKRPCVLPTYSRSTMLRVTLLLAGFFVGIGRATGEKEETTVAANTPTLIRQALDKRWLRRARNSSSAEPLWTPRYRQAPLAPETWDRLSAHPQFA